MNILITGASGFVGTNLIRFFRGLQYNIDVLDLGQPVADGVRTYFSWDRFEEVRFNIYDAVIHLAGMAHDTKDNTDESVYMNVNYGLAKKIFDKFLHSEAANFIFFSSVKAAADVVQADVLTEDVVPAPVGPYGLSKIKAEEYIMGAVLAEEKCMEYKNAYILRPCMIHGPGNKGNLNLLYKVAKSGIPWSLGAFHNLRSFTSIDNLSFLIEKLIGSGIPSGVYNVADDSPLSTNRLIELIAESRGSKARIWRLNPSCIKGMARVGDLLRLPLNSFRLKKLTENYVVSNLKLKKALRIDSLPLSAEDGIRRTLESFKG